jgi:hypothetical protein
VAVAVFIAVLAIVIIISLFQREPPKPKATATEYFQLSKATALATLSGATNDSILIQQISFNLTAIGGNATNVVVKPTQGNVNQEDWPCYLEMNQGKVEEIVVEFPSETPVLSQKQTEGYPVYFRITCDQAEGLVTVYASEYYVM